MNQIAIFSRFAISRFVVLLLSALLATPSVEAAYIRRVIGPGDPAPGVPGATFGGAVSWPAFDHLGNLRFHATIQGAGITWRNNEGFWMDSNGQLRLVARKNDPFPGGSDGELIGPWYVYGNRIDWTAFQIIGPQVDARNDQALISMTQGELRTVARAGQAAPGMPEGTMFYYVGYPHDDISTGYMAFDVRLIGPGVSVNNDNSLWVDDGTQLRTVVREGDLAPGVLKPFREFRAAGVDSLGRAVFTGATDSPDPLIQNRWGVYAERNGQIAQIIQEGIQAPGLPEGVVVKSVYPIVKGNGTLLLDAYLGGEGVTSRNDTAIYVERGNGLEIVYRQGDPIPSVTDTSNTSVGAGGAREDVLASVVANWSEYWELTDAGWRKIEWPKVGDIAPGTSNTLANITHRSNSLGRRAMIATLVGENGSQGVGQGVWSDDENGTFELVMRYDYPTESEVGIHPLFDEWELLDFNDRGEILLRHRYEPGAVYIASLSAIPEPATVLLALVGAVVVVVIAVRRRAQQRATLQTVEQTMPVRWPES